MNKVLSEIKSIPGIVGGFFFDSIQGVQLSNLPSLFKETTLNEMGKILDRMYPIGNSGAMDIADIFLYYEECTIIIRKIGKTSYLFNIGDPLFHENLLTMSMNMHVEKLKTIGSIFDQANESNEIKAMDSNPLIKSLSEEEVMNNSPVAEQLQEMQTALFEIVGPMAKIIFKDAVRDWIQSHDPSGSSIQTLIEILIKEINDPEKEQRYLRMVSS